MPASEGYCPATISVAPIMPLPSDNPTPTPIPESLRRQLDDFRRQLWRIKITEAITAGLLGLLVSFLLVFGLDRFWPTPSLVRLAILLFGTSLFVVFAPYWLRRWVWGHRREAQIARLIARRQPGLGDRLLGVIELQDQDESAESLSPRLRAAAMEAVAAEAASRKLGEALPPSRHRRWSFAVMASLALAAAVFSLAPRAGLNALRRWIMPLGDTPRYTFTVLDHPPESLAVPFGEAFELKLTLSPDSEHRPSSGEARYGHQPAVSANLGGNSYLFSFPGQQDPGVVECKIGDAIHRIAVTPVQRPSAESVTALIHYPAYLHLPPKSIDLRTGVLSTVQGGTVDIAIQTTRPLREAEFGPTIPDTSPAAEGTPAPPPFHAVHGSLTLQVGKASTPPITIGSTPFQIPFHWTDQLGLQGDAGFRLRVDPLPDQAPTVYLQGVDRQKALLPEETLEFEVFSEDDFGVNECGIEWQGELTGTRGSTAAKGEMQLAAGGPETRRLSHGAPFSPAAIGIGPQKLTLRAYAEDYLPGRGRVYSEAVTLYILTLDEHAQMLKSRFDRLLGELEYLARRERNQFEENQRLERLDGSELQKDQNQSRLKSQQSAENDNVHRMDEMSKNMEQLFKDAARNKDIDKDTLRKMADSMKSMKELAAQDMPKVEGKLSDSQDQRNTSEQAKQDMQDAVKEQQKVLDKMQEAIDKANEANRRFEAGTFVNRLKKAAGEESGIASGLIEGFNRSGGLSFAELDPSDIHRLEESHKQQTATASDLRWLQEDLGHYFTRTNKEIFKQILDEMQASKIDLGLDEVTRMLTLNHSAKSITSTRSWADQLNAWAKKLEGDMQSGGGGGGGQSPNPEDEDFEFNLRVMRLIQQQQDLRSRTRALEEFHRAIKPQTSTR